MVFVFQTFGIDDTLLIILFALLFSLLLVFLQKRFGGRDRIKEIQKQVNEHQKEVLAATKANDKQKLDELMKKQDEVMRLTQEMLWLSLKGMVIVLPIALIVFTYVLPALFPRYVIHLPFPLLHFPSFELRNYFGARGFFIYVSIFFGLALEAIIPKAEARIGKKIF